MMVETILTRGWKQGNSLAECWLLTHPESKAKPESARVMARDRSGGTWEVSNRVRAARAALYGTRETPQRRIVERRIGNRVRDVGGPGGRGPLNQCKDKEKAGAGFVEAAPG